MPVLLRLINKHKYLPRRVQTVLSVWLLCNDDGAPGPVSFGKAALDRNSREFCNRC